MKVNQRDLMSLKSSCTHSNEFLRLIILTELALPSSTNEFN